MKAVVKDANIIFTLLNTDLMDAFLQLDLQIWTSDFVVAEIEDTTQKNIINKYVEDEKIMVYNFDGNEVEEIFLMETGRSLSPADCSVYLLSKIKKAILLSSDKALRNYASQKGIDVKGIIWIMDKLVEHKLLKPEEAAEKLDYIALNSMWLPKEEVIKITRKWRTASKERK